MAGVCPTQTVRTICKPLNKTKLFWIQHVKYFLPDSKTFMLNSLLSLNVFPFLLLAHIALTVFCLFVCLFSLPVYFYMAGSTFLDTGLCYDILWTFVISESTFVFVPQTSLIWLLIWIWDVLLIFRFFVWEFFRSCPFSWITTSVWCSI